MEHEQQCQAQKGVRSPITRSGARRLGDEYQDLIALVVLVDWLEHSERYEWVQVEADGAGALDDVVARKRNGPIIYRQSKFSVHPDHADDPWTWEKLLKQEAGTQGKKLSSLLQDWAESLRRVSVSGQPVEAALCSNRDAADEIRQAFAQEDGTLLDLAKLPSQTRAEITSQLGGEESARFFFQCFHFRVNQPDLADLEEALWWRFSRLGGTHHGWLSLKEQLRFWVCHRNEPPPDGYIRLADVRRAARWHELEGLAQEYTIPDDYVPPQTFLQDFAQKVLQTSHWLHRFIWQPRHWQKHLHQPPVQRLSDEESPCCAPSLLSRNQSSHVWLSIGSPTRCRIADARSRPRPSPGARPASE